MEFCNNETKSMEIKKRPEAARRQKPCSKIEAKLLSRRRSKLENEEKKSTSMEETSKSSSSENDISPRLLTSKQHVSLVNFDSQRTISKFRKYVVNSPKKSEKCVKKIRNHSNCEIPISKSKTQEFLISKIHSHNLFDYSNKDSDHLKSIEKLDGGSNLLEIYSNKELQHLSIKETKESNVLKNLEFNKRRSRSAPCTPLFKIKCAKNKYPRDSLIDVKNLAANEIREKLVNSRTNNAPLYLRLSRSGDVSISSCEKSSNERIIEKTTSREPKIDNELILFHTNSQKLETSEAENFEVDPATDNSLEEEVIEAKEENSKSDETSDFGKNSQDLSNNLPKNDNIVENLTNEDIQENSEYVSDKKIEERINSVPEKPINRIEEKHVSPRKLPKKREFKWETILEKQHRQLTSNYISKNSKKSSGIIEKSDNNKIKLSTEKIMNTSSNNLPAKSRNSFEANKLAAYSAIKEELPRLFMKRQISDAMKKKKKDIEEKTKIIRESDNSNVRVWKKAEIAPRILDHCTKRVERTKQQTYRSQELSSKHSPKNNIHHSKFSMNIEETQETQRPSILKRRKTPSPRRVTFRLPGRVIDDEKSSNEIIQLTKNVQDEAIESDNFYDPLEEYKEKNVRRDNNQHFRGNDQSTEHDVLLNSSTRNQSRSFQVTKSLHHKATKNLAISPRFYAVGEQENYRESEDSEQDWETPTSEDTYRDLKDVQFPKETREAMNILRTAKANVQCDHFDHSQKITKNVERSFHNRKAANHRNQSLPIASSYAVALAKFQERCDDEGHSKSTLTSRQNRGFRNGNVAVGK